MTELATDNYIIRPIEASDSDMLIDAVMNNKQRLEKDFPSVVKRYSDAESARQSVIRAAQATADEASGLNAWIATDLLNTEAFGLITSDRLTRMQQRALRLISAWHGTQYGGLLGVHTLVDVSLVAGWTTAEHPKSDQTKRLADFGLEYALDPDNSVVLGACQVAMKATLIRPDNIPALKVAQRSGMVPANRWPGTTKLPLVSSTRQRAARLGDGIVEPRALWIHTTTNGEPLDQVQL